jgi:hypothetical protein
MSWHVTVSVMSRTTVSWIYETVVSCHGDTLHGIPTCFGDQSSRSRTYPHLSGLTFSSDLVCSSQSGQPSGLDPEFLMMMLPRTGLLCKGLLGTTTTLDHSRKQSTGVGRSFDMGWTPPVSYDILHMMTLQRTWGWNRSLLYESYLNRENTLSWQQTVLRSHDSPSPRPFPESFTGYSFHLRGHFSSLNSLIFMSHHCWKWLHISCRGQTGSEDPVSFCCSRNWSFTKHNFPWTKDRIPHTRRWLW